MRSTDGGTTWSTIGGATANTYTLGDADVGQADPRQVSYTDGHGTAESLSQRQRRPGSQRQRCAHAGRSPSPAARPKTRCSTADTSSIADADGLGAFSYQWVRSTDGGTTWSNIAGATASTYTLGDADVSALIR